MRDRSRASLRTRAGGPARPHVAPGADGASTVAELAGGGPGRGLAGLRGLATAEELFRRSPGELCRSCGFDRAALFRLRGPRVECVSVHPETAGAWPEDLRELVALRRLRLRHGDPEDEMMRERRPVLVIDAPERRTPEGLAEAVWATSYVAAPVVCLDGVWGFFLADRHGSGRAVSPRDRDRLWAFAEGCSYALDRAALLARLGAEREELRYLVAVAEAALGRLADARVPAGGEEDGRDASVAGRRHRAVDGLTRRELEVLGMLAEGMTNAAIASSLVISEGTVKSHVKQILRKMRVANRAEAVSRYLQASPAGGRDRGRPEQRRTAWRADRP